MKTASPEYLQQLHQVLVQSPHPELRELANEIGDAATS